MIDWPKYESRKIVQAAKVVDRIVHRDTEDWVLDCGDTIVGVKSALILRVPREMNPVGGYVVRYAGGFESWSPAEAFEAGYTRINE